MNIYDTQTTENESQAAGHACHDSSSCASLNGPDSFGGPVINNQRSSSLNDSRLKNVIESGPVLTVQREKMETVQQGAAQKQPNNTGMPDSLKEGIETLSGVSMNDVRVNYDSPKPKDIGAAAYTQGNNIHIAPGEQKHLAHEAWHAVQQKQDRVPAIGKIGNTPINDSPTLEKEADVMGAKAQNMNMP